MYQYLVENLKKIEYKLFCSQYECSRKATYEARSEKQKNDESKEDVGLDFVYTEAKEQTELALQLTSYGERLFGVWKNKTKFNAEIETFSPIQNASKK